MGVISGFAKRISGVFSLKGGIIGALAGGSAAALATKLNAAGEAGNTANARIQSVARSMGLFGAEAGVVAKRLADLAEKTELLTGVDRNAIIGIFLSAIGFLQKGLAEAIEIARPLAELFGKGDKIDAAQGTLRESAQILDDEAAKRFGRAGDLLAPAAEKIAERMSEASRNITRRFTETFDKTPEVIATAGFRDGFTGLVNDIKKSIPKPKERIIPVVQEPQDEETPAEDRSRKFSPIVTSLAKVGGGGYSTGALDAQRENNRLTGETNRLLQQANAHLSKLGGGGDPVVAFG